MTKYRVIFELNEEVEADDRREAIELAICQHCDVGFFIGNELTQRMYYDADVEEIKEEEEQDDEL